MNPASFVAGEKRFLHLRFARDTRVFGVAHDGSADVFRVAALGEDLVADIRVLFSGGVLVVIEIVEESGDGPDGFVLAELEGVGAHAGLDGHGVFSQTFRLGEFRE